MGEDIKSAYEAALQRLGGRGAPADASPLTEEQKAEIARVRREFAARRAEEEFLHSTALTRLEGQDDQEAILKLEREFRRQLARLAEQEDLEINAIRAPR